jgi:BioD-like phosphotransacetylase family protein
MDESQLESQLNDLQTDENELDEVLAKYDLDEALEAEFNDLESRFRNLQLHYQTLLNTRRFLNNG